jgi:hypothetical protein
MRCCAEGAETEADGAGAGDWAKTGTLAQEIAAINETSFFMKRLNAEVKDEGEGKLGDGLE